MYSFNKYEVAVANFILRTELGAINRVFKTEFDCMNFLFSVYGTGFEWKNGEIVYVPLYKFEMSEDTIKEAMSKSLSNLTLYNYNRLKNKFKFGCFDSTLFGDLFYVYPISKGYSLMTLIPDEIEQCWYDAISSFHKILNDNLGKLTEKDIKALRYSEKLLSKTKIKTC